MPSVNKIILVGHLGRDPELKYTASGTAYAHTSVATTEKYTRKDGEAVEDTEWHNLSIFGRLAEIIGERAKQGDLVYVEGRIQSREVEERTYYGVNVREMWVLRSKNGPQSSNAPDPDDLPF